jgi:hypothetical protein
MLAIGDLHHSNELKQFSTRSDHSDRFVAKSRSENSAEKAEL